MLRRLAAGLTPGTWSPLRVWLTAFAAFFALSVAWALASPLTSVPDEPFHMVKAAATVRGQLHGAPVTWVTHNGPVTNHVPMTGYRLPTSYADLVNLHECYFADAKVPASCARTPGAQSGVAIAGTTAGANNPLYYLAVGWPSLLSDGPLGMYGMRVVSAALCAAMLASAVVTASQWSRRRRYPLAAVLAAATPMVLFLAGSVNPNSLEAGAAILLWAAVLSLMTDPQPELVPRLLARAGLATLALVSVRQLGPAWAMVIVVCAALAGRPGALRAVLRRPQVWLWSAAVGAVGLGCVAWTAKFNVLVLSSGGSDAHPNLTFAVAAKHTLGQSLDYLRQMVGFFGWLDVRPPYHLAELWFVPVLALIAAACAVGKVRDVAALALLGISVIAIPVLAQGRQAQTLGYIWQGRYLLAVAAGLPLLAAAILAKRSPRRPALGRLLERLPLAVTASTLLLGFLMFYTTLRRYMVGSHGSWVPLHPVWSPPGSMVLVVVLYLVGAGLAALTVLGSRTPDDTAAPGTPGSGPAPATATDGPAPATATGGPVPTVVAPGDGVLSGMNGHADGSGAGRDDPGLLSAGSQSSAPGGR
ncbi:DUF2142 domain-containing protein [Catenulispora subtropica]|uniref:DUF2142 domain-containing protein n=1 Tax=Catenulispora subtropica TaxID=450798 RepID=A0ABN2TC84_9ACTN